MAQHLLLSAAARSLCLAKVMRLSDSGVESVFLRLRWPDTGGKPICPGCGCAICYACRRPAGPLRWRCKACRRDFSIPSGAFAWRKLPLRACLLAAVAFCNGGKGKSMLALARGLDVQHKTAFVLAHKLRDAVAKRSHGVMPAKPAGQPAPRGCGPAAQGRQSRSTALPSAAMSGRRTGPPTGSTGGDLKPAWQAPRRGAMRGRGGRTLPRKSAVAVQVLAVARNRA